MASPIQSFIDEYNELYSYLLCSGQVSSATQVNNHYRKILLFSCASYYESQINEILNSFVNKNSSDERLNNFIINKAINRQYHTYFDWKQSSNINGFLGLFGSNFKNRISKEIKDSPELCEYVRAFLIIGAERNKLAHENFLEYELNKTTEEIITLHNNASKFIDYLKSVLFD